MNQRFCHSDLVTDFVTVILSQTEGLGKMALGIVKYAYQSITDLYTALARAASKKVTTHAA